MGARTMNGVTVDPKVSTPLYKQVAAAIRRAIADGEAQPGERLPLAKDLAAVLGVNTNTVLRALRGLRDEGLLEFRRGRGITVAGTPEQGAVLRKVHELVEFVHRPRIPARRARGNDPLRPLTRAPDDRIAIPMRRLSAFPWIRPGSLRRPAPSAFARAILAQAGITVEELRAVL